MTMIVDLLTLYLPPLFALTAILLSLFALLAPTLFLHDQVALLTVVPSTAFFQSGPLKGVDGPSVFMGLLGSCSKTNDTTWRIDCTKSSFSPKYDLTALPSDLNARNFLSVPTIPIPVFVAVAISLSTIFSITSTLISFRRKLGGNFPNPLGKPMVQRLLAGVGFFGFLIGITSFLTIEMWFEKAVQDFNASIATQGDKGPQFIAHLGIGFNMAWAAYTIYAILVLVELVKFI